MAAIPPCFSTEALCLTHSNTHQPPDRRSRPQRWALSIKKCHSEVARWLSQGQYLSSHPTIFASEARDSKKPPHNLINPEDRSSTLSEAAAPTPQVPPAAGGVSRPATSIPTPARLELQPGGRWAQGAPTGRTAVLCRLPSEAHEEKLNSLSTLL